MDGIALIRRMHTHRRWVNERLLRTASGLSTTQLNRRFEMGQGSIWLSLTHLFGGEYVWLEALLSHHDAVAPGDAPGALPGNQTGTSPIASVEELSELWSQLEARWQQYLASLAPTDLNDMVTKTHSKTGVPYETPRCDVLIHVCTHAHYTTAQVTNMFRHVGVSPIPDPMLITWIGETGG